MVNVGVVPTSIDHNTCNHLHCVNILNTVSFTTTVACCALFSSSRHLFHFRSLYYFECVRVRTNKVGKMYKTTIVKETIEKKYNNRATNAHKLSKTNKTCTQNDQHNYSWWNETSLFFSLDLPFSFTFVLILCSPSRILFLIRSRSRVVLLISSPVEKVNFQLSFWDKMKLQLMKNCTK